MIEPKEEKTAARTVSVVSSALSKSKVSSKDRAGDKSSKETQHAAARRKSDLGSSRDNLSSHCAKPEKDPEKGSSEYSYLEPIATSSRNMENGRANSRTVLTQLSQCRLACRVGATESGLQRQ